MIKKNKQQIKNTVNKNIWKFLFFFCWAPKIHEHRLEQKYATATFKKTSAFSVYTRIDHEFTKQYNCIFLFTICSYKVIFDVIYALYECSQEQCCYITLRPIRPPWFFCLQWSKEAVSKMHEVGKSKNVS